MRGVGVSEPRKKYKGEEEEMGTGDWQGEKERERDKDIDRNPWESTDVHRYFWPPASQIFVGTNGCPSVPHTAPMMLFISCFQDLFSMLMLH